jgi:hypothetical protein
MAKIVKHNNPEHGPDYSFYCPGCECDHGVWTDKKRQTCWGFNGSMDKPTFTPSIKVTYAKNICHSFVKNGVIEFLNDCTHKLAGTKMELPDIDD